MITDITQTAIYVPSEEALKFIAFIRAAGLEENTSPEVHYKVADGLFSSKKKDWNIIIECTRGLGKALALDELVYTINGPVTIKDIQIGDKIYDHSGELTSVINKSDVFNDDTYEIEFADGNVITACKDHLWEVFTSNRDKKVKSILGTEYINNTQWYTRKVSYHNPNGKEQKYYVRLPEPVKYPEKDLPIDPYTLGVIIGDGNVDKLSGASRVTSHNDDADELFSYIPYDKGVNSTPARTSQFRSILGIGSKIKALGLNVNTHNKFIPAMYKLGSITQRLELLRGLMDTDGTVESGLASSFSSCNEVLAKDVVELVRSLGMSAKLSYRDNGHAGHYRVYIKHRNFNVFKLKRKANKVEFKAEHIRDYQKIKEVRKVATVPTQCITVDNEEHLFLTTGYQITHNSTLLEYAIIYISVIGHWPNFGMVPFIVFLGASLEGNVKAFFKNVQSKIENSNFLKNLLTIQRCVDNEIELVNKNNVETIITGRGMSTNWRGIRSKRGHRPSILVADDILPSEVMTSEALRSTIEMNWFSSALPALNPMKHKIIYIGTPLSEADLLHKLKNSGEYRIEKFPLCSKFPCTEIEYDSVWPDRFSFDYTSKMYNQYKSAGMAQNFYTEYMLEVTDLTTLLVDEDDIRWYEPDVLLKHKDHYNFYISTDFATSTKKSADFSVISVWAIGSDESWFLVDGQCKRQGMQDNLEDLFRYVHKWKPLSVGIETSGQQGGFLSILTDMMMSKNVWFQLAKKKGSKEAGIRPASDKTTRFITGVQPKFKQNKIWFPKPELISHKVFFNELLEELVNELSKYTLAGGHKALKHDDCVAGDTLVSMANGTYKKISDVEIGDEILTFDIDMLTQPVEAVMMTGVKEVNTYVFSDGSELTMSDKHPVLTTAGYIPAALLLPEDEVISWNNKNTKKENGHVKSQDTIKAQHYSLTEKESGCTSMFGNKRTGSSLRDFMSIIKMKIKIITTYLTWSYFLQAYIAAITDFKETWKNKKSIWQKLGHWLTNGIKQKQVKNMQDKTYIEAGKKYFNTTIKNVGGVKNQLQLDSLTGLPIATAHVNFKQYKQTLLDRKNSLVNGVAVHFCGIEKNQAVAKNANLISLCEKKDKRLIPTFNLEVANTHNFIANGIVVHNCIDTMNQLSEMDTFSPDTSPDEEWATKVDKDGFMWQSEWEEDKNVKYGGSTIF